MLGTGVAKGAHAVTAMPAPRILCPSCIAVFASASRLQRHLFQRHRTDGCYLRVNGSVAGPTAFLTEAVSSCELISLGSAEVRYVIEFSSDDRRRGVLDAGGTVQLLRGTDGGGFVGRLVVAATVGPKKYTWIVYGRDMPGFDAEPFDEIVMQAQAPLASGRPANLNLLSTRAAAVDSMGQLYLNGFAEYLIGTNLELRGDWAFAKQRFETAYGNLAVFATSLSSTARGVIELRMLATDRMRSRGPDSMFSAAGHFFRSPQMAAQPHVYQDSLDHRGLWIDDFQEATLAAVNFAYAGQPDEGRQAMLGSPALLAAEPSNQRRRSLILARLSNELGDVRTARDRYRDLRDDPVFGTEVTEYLGER